MALRRSHIVLGLIMAVAFIGMFGFSFGATLEGWLVGIVVGTCLAAGLTFLLFAEEKR